MIRHGLLSLDDDVLTEPEPTADTEVDAVWRDEFWRRIDEV